MLPVCCGARVVHARTHVKMLGFASTLSGVTLEGRILWTHPVHYAENLGFLDCIQATKEWKFPSACTAVEFCIRPSSDQN